MWCRGSFSEFSENYGHEDHERDPVYRNQYESHRGGVRFPVRFKQRREYVFDFSSAFPIIVCFSMVYATRNVSDVFYVGKTLACVCRSGFDTPKTHRRRVCQSANSSFWAAVIFHGRRRTVRSVDRVNISGHGMRSRGGGVSQGPGSRRTPTEAVEMAFEIVLIFSLLGPSWLRTRIRREYSITSITGQRPPEQFYWRVCPSNATRLRHSRTRNCVQTTFDERND